MLTFGLLVAACGARSSLGSTEAPDASFPIDGASEQDSSQSDGLLSDSPSSTQNDASDDQHAEEDSPPPILLQWIDDNVLAFGISGDGLTVVGYHVSSAHPNGVPFRWMSSLGIQDLEGEGGSAQATNADGTVIVGSVPGATDEQPAMWKTSAPSVIYPTGTVGIATAISADGQLIAGTLFNSSPKHGFALAAGSNLQILPVVGSGSYFRVGASADGSTIVGLASAESGLGFGAALWTSASGLEDILIPGQDWSEASATNIDGTVVVGTVDASRAFVWTAVSGAGQLLSALAGMTSSKARAVNSDGHVIVGQSCNAQGCSGGATVWIGGAPGLVSNALVSLGVDLAGGVLDDAVGVSFDGTVIVGNGHAPGGKSAAWIARLP